MSAQEKGPSQASGLVSLAKARYDLVMSEDGRPYGVRRNGPNVALPLRGKAGLRSQLAKQFVENNGGQVPSQSALADAMTVLEGIAGATDPVPVHLRVAGDSDCVVIDLGTADGRCVVVTADGWNIQARSPVLFRRSGAMAPMPVPEPDGTDGHALLRGLVNMDDTAFRQLVAWLVAAWIPHIPHPVLTFKGEQGTGKSKAAQMVINLIDPSAATKRSQPRDVKTWATQAFNSWAICLDNVSTIQPWFSDTLCKAVTGDGIVDRALYTDDDVVVLAFRRVLSMTTIDAGALAGDLAERLMMLELQLIPEHLRRTEEELDSAYTAARPAILASLFDLLAAVLREMPSTQLERMPRMADFARVLATVDRIQGWSTLPDYLKASEQVAIEALEGDPFASAVMAFIETHGAFNGPVSQLLNLLPPPDMGTPKWPKTPKDASSRLRRFAPALRVAGVGFDAGRGGGHERGRFITLTPTSPEIARKSASDASFASDASPDLRRSSDALFRGASDGAESASDGPGVGRTPDASRTHSKASASDETRRSNGVSDAKDASDALFPPISGYHLRCAGCGQPMDPELTTAGHLVHPVCPSPSA